MHSQENKSQLSLTSLNPVDIVNKCPMKERLSFYEREILRQLGNIDPSSALRGSSIIHETKYALTP